MALYLCVVLGHYKAETSADCCVVVAVPCTMTRDHFLSCWNIGLHQSGDPVAVILNTILLAKPLWTSTTMDLPTSTLMVKNNRFNILFKHGPRSNQVGLYYVLTRTFNTTCRMMKNSLAEKIGKHR